MKCPHCGYTHGWQRNKDTLAMEFKFGTLNEFWAGDFARRLQDRHGRTTSLKRVTSAYGCPSCNLVFIAPELPEDNPSCC